MTQTEIPILIRRSIAKKILFLPHAVRQMTRPDRMISPSEIRNVLINGKIIERYPEDARGYSCLMMGHGNKGQPIHVVCSPKDEYLSVITAYIPSILEWDEGFEKRKQL